MMNGTDKIDKLIEVVSKQNELLGPGQHSIDATELKKEWFNYVLLTLEKAQSAIDKLEQDQHANGRELLLAIAQIKDDLRLDMTNLRLVYDKSLEKLERRIEKSIDFLGAKVESISPLTVKQELTTEITKLKGELLQYINKTKEDLRVVELDPLKKSVTTLTVKVALFGVVGGFVGTGIIAIISALIKYFTGSP